MAVTSEHEKLEITACSVSEDGTVSVDENDTYEFMLNPQSYQRIQSIGFSNEKALGEIGNRKRFYRIEDDSVSFEVIVDGTGVVTQDASTSVDEVLGNLTSIAGYDGGSHEPKHSRLIWGTFVFYGRMHSMETEYTLFKPSGEPLRAKVKLEFVKFMTDQEENKEANRSSPDLSHIVVVKQGDTLPLLCSRIYNDAQYYTDIAKINALDNFRALVPGDKLLFPPLR